jgi:geranylgeranyl diphosphate synthase, type I
MVSWAYRTRRPQAGRASPGRGYPRDMGGSADGPGLDGMSAATVLGPVREPVGRALESFLERQRQVVLGAAEELRPGLTAIGELLAGGKRLRAAFCYWGWRGAAGGSDPGIYTAAAALELLHASALVHDDVIDGSDTRRGGPSMHRRFAARHCAAGWQGSAESFGSGTAILMGDLLLSWTDEMFYSSGLPPAALGRGSPVLSLMRTEVMAGQYLDLLEQARASGTVDGALRVARLKTARYTIERPLQLGAALAADEAGAIRAAYSRYGLPLGTAFQLRDDLLGVFGDPAQTGKPAGDDVREGKRTVLVAIALAKAGPAGAAVLTRRLGDPMLGPEGVDEVRSVISDTGALAECEALIERYTAEAVTSLEEAPVTAEAKEALAELAVAATSRIG